MQALTVRPGQADSAEIVEVAEPERGDGDVLVETLLVGICGTDHEIIDAEYGEAPPGEDVLVLGHESLGRVVEPAASGPSPARGDLVVPMVRWPDPVPCASCAAGEWDMCRNGEFTEHGISGRHGFARERFTVPATRLVAIPPELGDLGVLLEPASVVAKAWEQIDWIAQRTAAPPRVVLVTGAGPIGLLAALLAVQRGFEVHVLDKATEGPKPKLVADLAATYHSSSVADLEFAPEIVMECTGAPAVILEVLTRTSINGITCLTGVSSSGRKTPVDLGGLNRSLVLENDVVFGSVNANRRHYEAAVDALVKADAEWLGGLITRRVPLPDFATALERQDDDVKVVLTVA